MNFLQHLFMQMKRDKWRPPLVREFATYLERRRSRRRLRRAIRRTFVKHGRAPNDDQELINALVKEIKESDL